MKAVHVSTYIRKIRQHCVHVYLRKSARKSDQPRFTKKTLQEVGFHSSGEFDRGTGKLVLNITIER